MKKSMFKELSETERRAKLLIVLANKAKELTKTELETIVNTVDINNQYEITVVRDCKELAYYATLKDYDKSHSWAGGEFNKEEAYTIYGDIEYGVNYSHEYFDNGNSDGREEYVTEPNFDIDQRIAFTIDTHNYYSWEGNSFYENNHTYELIIYIPNNKGYSMDEEVKYILENFNIK